MKINLWPFWQSRKIVYTDLWWIRWKSRTNWQRNGEGDSNSRKKHEERESVWPLSSYQKIKRGKNVHLFRDWYSKPNQVESLTKTTSESICKTFVDTKRIYLNLTNVAQQEKKPDISAVVIVNRSMRWKCTGQANRQASERRNENYMTQHKPYKENKHKWIWLSTRSLEKKELVTFGVCVTAVDIFFFFFSWIGYDSQAENINRREEKEWENGERV